MSKIFSCGITTTLFALIFLVPLVLRAELVDRIVATVNKEVITASELSSAIAVNLRLGGADNDRSALEAETLEGLVTRRLLVQEAHRLKFVEVTEQELSAELERFEKRFSSDREFGDFLAGLDMTRRELARVLGEKILVERFVEKKVGLFVRVSREEAQRYFDEHSEEFRNNRFQDVQKKILALLTEQEIGLHLDQYLAELRKKADIRTGAR